jgi:hypothetical protein
MKLDKTKFDIFKTGKRKDGKTVLLLCNRNGYARVTCPEEDKENRILYDYKWVSDAVTTFNNHSLSEKTHTKEIMDMRDAFTLIESSPTSEGEVSFEWNYAGQFRVRRGGSLLMQQSEWNKALFFYRNLSGKKQNSTEGSDNSNSVSIEKIKAASGLASELSHTIELLNAYVETSNRGSLGNTRKAHARAKDATFQASRALVEWRKMPFHA